MQRPYLNLIWYDKKKYKLPIPKKSWWFNDSRGKLHCTASCSNIATVFYISDRGLASIAYCEGHAVSSILQTMITGNLERGLWCTISLNRLKPHWYYELHMEYLKKSNPIQAKKLQIKINKWKKMLANIRGVKQK
jgi:hypothetical protein